MTFLPLSLAFCTFQFEDFAGNDHVLLHQFDRDKLEGLDDWSIVAGAHIHSALRSFLETGTGLTRMQSFADSHGMASNVTLVDQILRDVGNVSPTARWLVFRRERETYSFLPHVSDHEKREDTLKETVVNDTAKDEEKDIFITAKLASEYLVVPVDKKLSAFQPSGEAPRKVSPLRLEIELQQKPKAPAAKAEISVVGAGKLAFFSDEKMKNPVASAALSQLTLNSGKLELWMLGEKSGKVELSVKGSTTAIHYTENKPAKLELLVAELVAQIGEQDHSALAKLKCDPDVAPVATYFDNLKTLALPEQKVIPQKERIKTGRILHVQKSKSHGRAKLVLPKIDPALVPAGAQDHQVVHCRCGGQGGREAHALRWGSPFLEYVESQVLHEYAGGQCG